MSYTAGHGGTLVRSRARRTLAAVDTVIFDVDGVLVDTSRSYPEAICQAVHLYFTRILRWPGEGELVVPADSDGFKQAGGFNNDWHVAQAVVLFYLAKAARIGAADLAALRRAPPTLAEFTAALRQAGGGMAAAERVALSGLPAQLRAGVEADWDRALIERLCMEVYGGEDACEEMFGFTPRHVRGPGLWRLEAPLLDRSLLGGPRRWQVGIYTGRVRSELGPALRLVGLHDPAPAAICTADGPYVKPDPAGLDHLAGLLDTRVGVFCGDTVDDARTVLNHRAGRRAGEPPAFLFAGILNGGLGPDAETIFRNLKADVIAPDVNAVLRLLAE